MIKSHFGLFMRQSRQMVKLSKEELAHRIGCEAGEIRAWEESRGRPHGRYTMLLAMELKLTKEQIQVMWVTQSIKQWENEIDPLTPEEDEYVTAAISGNRLSRGNQDLAFEPRTSQAW